DAHRSPAQGQWGRPRAWHENRRPRSLVDAQAHARRGLHRRTRRRGRRLPTRLLVMEQVSPLPHREIVLEPRRGWLRIEWRELWEYRDLLVLLVRRDFLARYQ